MKAIKKVFLFLLVVSLFCISIFFGVKSLFFKDLDILEPINILRGNAPSKVVDGTTETTTKEVKKEDNEIKIVFDTNDEELLETDYVDNGIYPFSNPPAIEDDGSIIFDGMTVTELTDKLNRNLKGYVTNTGYLFANYTRKTGLDPYLAVSIMLLESGCNGTCSNLTVNYNNVGGLKGSTWLHFDTLDEGINTFLDIVYKNYYAQGLRTPETMSCKYNLCSQHWIDSVNNYMRTIKNR